MVFGWLSLRVLRTSLCSNSNAWRSRPFLQDLDCKRLSDHLLIGELSTPPP
jgi:hypothetical protein